MIEESIFRRLRHKLGNYEERITKPRGKRVFLNSLPQKAVLLDVGCGNHSPENIKRLRPDIYYTGIDVADYNTDEVSKSAADKYILTTGEDFADAISGLDIQFDAAISSHNLEHCNHPFETLDAICGRLKKGGRLYLAFPCEKSVFFPSRAGTLNFYDDETHSNLPELAAVMKNLVQKNRMFIDFVSASYKPLIAHCLGIVSDFFIRDRHTRYTWPHYGFETIIWAHKE